MNPTQLTHHLTRLNACSDAREWARGKSLKQAWDTCPRADWLLWLAARADVDRRAVAVAACACARYSLHLFPAGEARPLTAIETAERWAVGEATIEEVRAAAANAAYAANAANAAYAAYAAAAAANAAYASRTTALREMCTTVRALIPWTAVRDVLEVLP